VINSPLFSFEELKIFPDNQDNLQKSSRHQNFSYPNRIFRSSKKMKRLIFLSMVSAVFFIGIANGQTTGQTTNQSTGQKISETTKKAAKATSKGVEKGYKVSKNVAVKGAKATVSGIKKIFN
jgi:hypothetical protein